MSHTAVERKIDKFNLFDCKDLTQLKSAIIRVLPYKGISNSRFYTCEMSGVRFLTKLCFYRAEDKKDAEPHMLHPTDAEIAILRAFKITIVDKNLTPCILEMIYHRTCDGIRTMIPDKRACNKLMQSGIGAHPADDLTYSLCRYAELVEKKLAANKCAFLVLDTCDMTFGDFVGRGVMSAVNYAVFKSLLFMIIHALYVINKVYPGFKHYDLHTDNIMLKFDADFVFNQAKPTYVAFPIGADVYYVPYFGITPKIIDFGNSTLPEENAISSAVANKVHMHYRAQNDLLFLFYWIYATIESSHGDLDGNVARLLQKLEPNGTFRHYHTESIRAIEDRIPSYLQMITNPVWNSYKTGKPAGIIYHEFSAPTEVYDI